MRLEVSEWSVEYDELIVTVWASTAAADYKLISAAPLYKAFWETMTRKTVRRARPCFLRSSAPFGITALLPLAPLALVGPHAPTRSLPASALSQSLLPRPLPAAP